MGWGGGKEESKKAFSDEDSPCLFCAPYRICIDKECNLLECFFFLRYSESYSTISVHWEKCEKTGSIIHKDAYWSTSPVVHTNTPSPTPLYSITRPEKPLELFLFIFFFFLLLSRKEKFQIWNGALHCYLLSHCRAQQKHSRMGVQCWEYIQLYIYIYINRIYFCFHNVILSNWLQNWYKESWNCSDWTTWLKAHLHCFRLYLIPLKLRILLKYSSILELLCTIFKLRNARGTGFCCEILPFP